MSRQFSFLATDVDLQALEISLRGLGDVELLSDLPTEGDRSLQPLASLAIPVPQAGKVSLFCFVAPVRLPQRIVLNRVSAVKVSVDEERSHLIELWRPFYNGQVIRRGRLYYENWIVENDALVPKSPDFCRWADHVFARVKRAMKYDKERYAYLGKDAAGRIASGTLTVIT